MLNPTLLATMLTPLNAATPPAPAPSTDGEPGAFGRELARAEKAAHDDPAAPPARERRSEPERDREHTERAPVEPRATGAERRPAEPAKPKGKGTQADDAARSGAPGEAADTRAARAGTEAGVDDDGAASEPGTTPAGTETPADVASWLAQMAQRPELTRERGSVAARGSATPDGGAPTDVAAGAGSDLSALADGAARTPQAGGDERWPAVASDRARGVGGRAEAPASPTATAVLAAQAEARAAFETRLGEAVSAAATGSRSEGARGTDGLAALAAVATTGASGSAATGSSAPAPHAAAAVAEDTIAPPVGSRDFAQALGARVAVFARDGIEHARLNLHPAELGPISLQLALDGTQLRVDMAAEAAQTRQVLEQSLPGLASALRDAGLTLSGGGVFQQARDGRSGFGDAARASGGGRDDGESGGTEPVLASRPARMDGLVDLYA